MSERVQLLLSDRILGMTLVPEGRIWNYGVGLTQMWTSTLRYDVTLDTPLLFWAEQHRPSNFLSVSSHLILRHTLLTLSSSLPTLKLAMTVPILRIVSLNALIAYTSHCI